MVYRSLLDSFSAFDTTGDKAACPVRSDVAAQNDVGKAGGHLSGHTHQRPLRLISGEVESVVFAGPGQVGRHILQQFPYHVDLAAVVAGVLQRGHKVPQVLDGPSLQLERGGHSRRAAVGLFQITVELLHQLGIGDLLLQFCHTLEDGVCPEPALILPGGSALGPVTFPPVLPLDSVNGEALAHKGNIKFVHDSAPLIPSQVLWTAPPP